MKPYGIFRLILIFLSLALGLMLFACFPNLPQSMVSNYDNLNLRFESNRSSARVGDRVEMRFTVKNVGNKPIKIQSRSGPVLDIQVNMAGSDKIFLLWSAQHPDQAASELEWQPGESKTIEAVWIPKQEDYTLGFGVQLYGFLREGSRIVKDAGVIVCFGGCDR